MEIKFGGENTLGIANFRGLLECPRYVMLLAVAINVNGFRDESMRYPFNQIIVREQLIYT